MRQTSLLRMRHALIALMLAFILCSFIPLRRAQAAAAGSLDQTFGLGGKVVTTFFNGVVEGAKAVVSRADGHLFAAGYASDPLTGVGGFALASYNANGSLDSTFGSGGKTFTSIFGAFDSAEALAIQPDGKIVAVGYSQNSFDLADGISGALARYNTNGSLDASFGSGGKMRTTIPHNQSYFFAVAIQSDGKIVAAGETQDLQTEELLGDFFIARYNSNGSLDTSFGKNGIVVSDLFGYSEEAHGLFILPDGHIIVGGSGGPPQDAGGIALARYNNDGSLDTTFGTGGKVHGDLGPDGTGRAIALQSDGKIVAGGNSFSQAAGIHFALSRFLPDGQLDESFGTDGKTFTDFGLGAEEIIKIAIQSDGRIVAAGVVADILNTVTDFGIARYNSDGSLDQSFGTGGKVTTDFSGNFDSCYGLTIQPNGRIVAAGLSMPANPTNSHFVLAGYAGKEATFDQCIQDDSNHNLLQLNSVTGEYQFTNCGGMSVGGTGTVTRLGNLITLQHNVGDRRVTARIDLGTHRATASVQLLSTGKSFTITDRNTTDNTCSCK